MWVFQTITLHRATNSAQSRNKIRLAFHFVERNYFQDFETKAKYKILKENRQKPLIQVQLFIFYETRLLTEKFSRTTTIHPGIFGGRALWADSGPPRMNTIASRDQFKPTRIGEKLVVSYNG